MKQVFTPEENRKSNYEMSEALANYRSVWERKPVLRMLYDDLFARLAACCIPGPTLEVGGGIGNLKDKIENLISSDTSGRCLPRTLPGPITRNSSRPTHNGFV